MAIMIPEKPREFTANSREDLMFEALSRLPDDYYVVHSFQINKVKNNSVFDSEADFVIFNRHKGILCIEAKATQVKYAGGEWLYGNGRIMHSGGPFAQARRNMYAMRDYMAEHGLENIVPVCKFLYAVWFPLVTEEYINALCLPSEAAPEHILTEEAINEPEKYIEKIFSLTEHGKTETELNESLALRIVNEVLCPQFDIAPSATFDVDTKHMIFHKLLKEQASVLNFLEEQKTAVINGAAGTGKTLVAVEKAKRQAARGEKVLFLCFNNQLKNHLAETYPNENIDFYTVAALACKFGNTPEPDYGRLNSILEDMWESGNFPYQHIVVDEGQDFGSIETEETDILETLRAIIEDTKENGSFYVFYDRLQMVQARSMPKFIENADCKMTLYRNCRNTENIAKTSLRPISERTPKLMDGAIVGAPARLHFCPDEACALSALDGIIDANLEDGIENIVILTCGKEKDSFIAGALKNGKYPAGKRKITFTTCRKFKGLEADAVILTDVCKDTFTGNDGQNVLLYYVGTSRARLRLDILTTMTDSDCADVLQEVSRAERSKRPVRDFARYLNALPVMEEEEE